MDIDLDLADRRQLLDILEHRVASLENGKKHNTGVYFNEIPHNPINKVATIDHKSAEKRGYFKIDLLNVHIYNDVSSPEHLDKLAEQEPIWELFERPEITDQLFHLQGHSAVLQKIKPRSVEDLAIALALIRPSKRHLLKCHRKTIDEKIWEKPKDGSYHFKKAHSFSYALAVIVHMNLLCEKLIDQAS